MNAVIKSAQNLEVVLDSNFDIRDYIPNGVWLSSVRFTGGAVGNKITVRESDVAGCRKCILIDNGYGAHYECHPHRSYPVIVFAECILNAGHVVIFEFIKK